MKPKHALRPNDVVKIMHPAIPTFGSKTGVVNRVDALTGMVNVFPKGVDIGTWFETKYLKRIGGKGGTK